MRNAFLACLLGFASCTASNPDYAGPGPGPGDGGGTVVADLSHVVNPTPTPDLSVTMHCGDTGGACCPNQACNDPKASCVNGTCGLCGGAGQPCCANNGCASGGCCLGGTCAANGASCGVQGFTCQDGSCTGFGYQCGGAGQACCPTPNGSICTSPGTICDQSQSRQGVCTPCGGDRQSCCDGKVCNNGGCCIVINGYVCAAPGSGCGFGPTCNRGSCGGCGAVGQDCCDDGAGHVFCVQSHTVCAVQGNPRSGCVTCGHKGEYCCPPNDTCEGGLQCDNNGTCR